MTLAVAACQPDRRRPSPPPPPDIVVIVVDALRTDALGCYGSSLGQTPTIDALARRGARFDRALSTSSWTVPAVASLVTGLWSHQHGVEQGTVRHGEAFRQPRLGDRYQTVAERLHEAGYFTAAAMANVHLTEPLGFAQGFELFHAAGWGTSRDVLRWVEEHRERLIRRDRPRLLWFHLFDPHHPYRPRQPWFSQALDHAGGAPALERPGALAWHLAGRSMAELEARDDLDPDDQGLRVMRAAYLSEVALVDQTIATLLERLELGDDALVVVTADHGEEFRDHGRLGHRQSLYAEVVRVPLIIALPGRRQGGQVFDEPVSIVDIFPTLLELSGLPRSQALPGVSLLQQGRLVAPPRRPLLSTLRAAGYDLRSQALGPLRLIVDGQGQAELFNERSDPSDRVDLARERPAEVAALRRQLEAGLAAPATPEVSESAVSDEVLEQLRHLGYLDK